MSVSVCYRLHYHVLPLVAFSWVAANKAPVVLGGIWCSKCATAFWVIRLNPQLMCIEHLWEMEEQYLMHNSLPVIMKMESQNDHSKSLCGLWLILTFSQTSEELPERLYSGDELVLVMTCIFDGVPADNNTNIKMWLDAASTNKTLSLLHLHCMDLPWSSTLRLSSCDSCCYCFNILA